MNTNNPAGIDRANPCTIRRRDIADVTGGKRSRHAGMSWGIVISRPSFLVTTDPLPP